MTFLTLCDLIIWPFDSLASRRRGLPLSYLPPETEVIMKSKFDRFILCDLIIWPIDYLVESRHGSTKAWFYHTCLPKLTVMISDKTRDRQGYFRFFLNFWFFFKFQNLFINFWILLKILNLHKYAALIEFCTNMQLESIFSFLIFEMFKNVLLWSLKTHVIPKFWPFHTTVLSILIVPTKSLLLNHKAVCPVQW